MLFADVGVCVSCLTAPWCTHWSVLIGRRVAPNRWSIVHRPERIPSLVTKYALSSCRQPVSSTTIGVDACEWIKAHVFATSRRFLSWITLACASVAGTHTTTAFPRSAMDCTALVDGPSQRLSSSQTAPKTRVVSLWIAAGIHDALHCGMSQSSHSWDWDANHTEWHAHAVMVAVARSQCVCAHFQFVV